MVAALSSRTEEGFLEESDAHRWQPALPYHMVWLVTNACNARCVHCSSAAASRLPGELTTNEAEDMLDQFAECGVLDLAISGGEPLLRPDIFHLLEHARDRRIRCGIGSNGSPVTPEVVRRLRDAEVTRIQISIDGLQATHDLARRWVGLFKRAMRAIELAKSEGMPVHVCFTVHRLNVHDLAAVIDLCAELGVNRFNMSRFVPTGRGTPSLDLPHKQWKSVAQTFLAKRAEHESRMSFTTHLAQLVLLDNDGCSQESFRGCQAGIGQGCVDSIGQVTPCVMMPTVIGSIREKRFRELWEESPLIQALHDRSNLKGPCGTCAFRERCGGCRGVAFAYSGDPLASDPRCWLHHPSDKTQPTKPR